MNYYQEPLPFSPNQELAAMTSNDFGELDIGE